MHKRREQGMAREVKFWRCKLVVRSGLRPTALAEEEAQAEGLNVVLRDE